MNLLIGSLMHAMRRIAHRSWAKECGRFGGRLGQAEGEILLIREAERCDRSTEAWGDMSTGGHPTQFDLQLVNSTGDRR